MTYNELENRYKALGNNPKTKDLRELNKSLIKENVDVSFLKDYLLKDDTFHRTYFEVSLKKIKNYEDQFKFIEDNAYLLYDWWHVDQLTQFISKRKIPFDYYFKKQKEYINSNNSFLRRWGYVLIWCGYKEDEKYLNEYLSLFKNDPEYYVIMAEAWMLCELAIYHFDKVYEYLMNSNLDYKIISKAIQKCLDSYRISKENKIKLKELRTFIKNDKNL